MTKKTLAAFLLIILCASTFASGKKDTKQQGNSGVKVQNPPPASGAGTPIAKPSVPSRNRGQGIRLAVLAPDGKNFAAADNYLAAFAQGRLNDIFSKYSAMTIIDRQNLDTVLDEQQRSLNGTYSDEDYVRIGGLTNSQYILAGTIIKLSANEFSVQLGITNTETGERRTSFTKNCSITDLRQGKVINEAAAELLAGMGVELTGAEKQEILNGQAGSTEAETALARGIAAQRSGSAIEALTYFYQAASFDSSLTEATGRLNTLTTNITGGNIGEAVQSDYQARMTWLNLFKECTAFYKDHPPFEILYEPDLTQGEIDFGKGTVDLSFRIALTPSDSGFRVLNDLLNRLEQTGNRDKWGFAGWPLLDIQPREPAAVVFGGKREFSFKVEAAIINENGKTIATGSININSRALDFSSGEHSINAPIGTTTIFKFPKVNANDLTENLVIKIAKIDGMDAGIAGERGYIRIAVESRAQINQMETAIKNKLARIAAEEERIAAEEARIAAEQIKKQAELQKIDDANRGIEAIAKYGFRREDFTFSINNGTIRISGYNGNIKDVIIPGKINNIPVTAIGYSAFKEKELTSVILPNSIKVIENEAFYKNKLTSIIIPNNVNSIGSSAFSENNLTSIIIAGNVRLDYNGAFGYKATGFDSVYKGKEGTYIKINSYWTKQ